MKKILSLILVAIMLVTAMPMAFAEGNTYKVGDIIQFGSYPQSEVKDETLIAELNALAPEWEDWTSYGYYSGNGEYGSMVQGDWMRYTDVTYNGKKYRGVKFTQYRPYATNMSSPFNYIDQYENGYNINTVYWFKFESIDWRILDPTTGFVMCEKIIDCQPYSNTIYFKLIINNATFSFFNDASYKNYASDYETSSIRKWLNEDFYNTAFTDSEKKEISTTTLNNDGYYTSIGTIGNERLDSNETKDKLFLLSYNEVKNSNLGFNSDHSVCDQARFAKGSDYAQSQGLSVGRSSESFYNGNSCWFLRSPGAACTDCCYVGCDGTSQYIYGVNYTIYGVRPALRFNDITNIHKHTYKSVITNPTCTTPGYTTYTCECGDSYIDDFVDERHTFNDEWTIDEEPTCKNEGLKSRHCKFCPARTDIKTIDKLAHNFVSVRVEPTCLDEGYTITGCNCGIETIEAVPAKGHNFNGSICKDCDYDQADDCSCNCHKRGIPNLIFKIILFFQKLFRTNSVCTCGAAHY